MSLENIVKKIEDQAGCKAGKILTDAEAKVKEIEEKADEHLNMLENETKKEEAAIESEVKNSIVLPAKLKVRGDTLSAKKDLVNRAFKKAMNFSDDEYLKILDFLFSQIPSVKEAVVYPAEGTEEITKNYVEQRNLPVEFGKAEPDILGGFLLKSGKIEYDCSFVTLLRKLKEKLEPEIAPLFMLRQVQHER